MQKAILKYAVLNALGTLLYIALVASFLSHTAQIFGNSPEHIVLIPIAMLLLFVCSASITAGLVLGRPVLWYLDGKKKEAVQLFIVTVGCLFLATFVAFFGLAMLKK